MNPGAARIAVIGGGWAGLACAVELTAAGRHVCLFEAAPQVGGRARRVEADGHALDNGQHILLGAYRECLRLLRLCSAEPESRLLRLPLELATPDGFRIRLPRLPAPWHLALGLLSARGCTLREKVAAARFVRALQATHFRLDTDTTVDVLLDRYGQHGGIRRFLWEALCLSALNTPPARASAQTFATVLRDSLGGSRDDTDLLLPRVDLGRVFPDAAVDFIVRHGGEIRRASRVGTIACTPRAGAGHALRIGDEDFAAIVIATAPQHAAELLRANAETAALAALIDGYRYEPIGTVYLGYPENVRLPAPMLGLDDGRPGRIGQWVFDRGRLTGSAGVLACVLSASGDWERFDNAGLAAALHGELERALGRRLPAPRWQRVIRERRATFACAPNLVRPPARTPLAGVWLGGDYVCAGYPATLEGAVRSGVAAARGLLGTPADAAT